MILFFLAYLAGVFTIASPCIVPILPFVLARSDRPFRRGNLPMLVGMALAFAVAASLAAFAGGWAIALSSHARILALVLVAGFGLALLFPALAARWTRPFVILGERLARSADERQAIDGTSFSTSMLLGVAVGLIWAPCAGPVLGLVLAGAALSGPSLETSLLLLAYAAGAATSLAAALLAGGRLMRRMQGSLKFSDGLRRGLGAAILASVTLVSLGLDAGLLTRLSLAPTSAVEFTLIDLFQPADAGQPDHTPALATPAQAAATVATPLFGATQWINTTPVTAESTKGKVVLVNFWTYSCINCLRALPHVRAWADKYKDLGLVVVGVHTPEFAFEKDAANVAAAVAALGISYPVAIDNDFRIWRAFGNRAWPALYFIGADGQVRDHVLGEGHYDQSERLIQQLLAEASDRPIAEDLAAITGEGPQAAADENNLGSGETYIGYARASNFASPDDIDEDTPGRYRGAPELPLNHWSLSGVWTIGAEFATLNEASGTISHRFHARDLHLVLSPGREKRPIRFRITLDGVPPGVDHGVDVDADGWGYVREERLYQLIRQAGPVMDRTFEITFFDAGARAYAFTFG